MRRSQNSVEVFPFSSTKNPTTVTRRDDPPHESFPRAHAHSRRSEEDFSFSVRTVSFSVFFVGGFYRKWTCFSVVRAVWGKISLCK